MCKLVCSSEMLLPTHLPDGMAAQPQNPHFLSWTATYKKSHISVNEAKISAVNLDDTAFKSLDKMCEVFTVRCGLSRRIATGKARKRTPS